MKPPAHASPAVFLSLLVLLWPAATEGEAATAPVRWEPLGLGGGGAMFTPAISPCDGRVMMVNCDMSGAYITTDGGGSWRMIHHSQLRSNTRCRPAFHPRERETVFAANGWGGRLSVSDDLGQHWEAIGNLPRDLRGEIAIDPRAPERMLAGTSREVWRTQDGGRTWTRCEGPTGTTVGFHFDQTSPTEDRVCFAATADGVWRSDDGGLTWTEKSAGLPLRGLRSFCGGSNAAEGVVLLYCAVPGKVVDGRYAGGVFRSSDRGDTWQSVMTPALNMDTEAADRWAMGSVAQYHRVLTTNARPSVVYALNANTGVRPPHHTAAYRSDDGGRSWRATFYPDPRFSPCNVEQDYVTAGVRQFYQDVPTGAAIDPSDPEHVVQVDGGRCYVTTDGGKSWQASHTRLTGAADPTSRDAAWLCTGLVVTTTWNYYIDPFEPQRHCICYTDIGFARSLDAGKSWRWWSIDGRSPWANTCYELAFDPQEPGKVWGAFSNVHDIPNANIILGRHRAAGEGGVCLSLDFGQTWEPVGQGLPKAPVLSVVVDPKSPKGSRTLYASVFGHGVFRSTDDGRTWQGASRGLGSTQNMRTCRLQLHPDGSLFVLITAMRTDGRFLPDGVGLYRSRDRAATWEPVNRSQPLLWPKDFTVDPADSRVVYLGAADAGGKREGGLYATSDGGGAWKLLARKGPEHFGAYLHPQRPGWIYMTLTEDSPGAGLWLSKDGGATWTAMDGLPFANAQRVAFDPVDADVIYVTTFGGSVWRGPASE
jgi:photosystem II stability/assembly factor-like uncharacterized protein